MIVKYDKTLSYVLTYYSLLHTSWTIALIVHVWIRVLKIWLQLGLRQSIMRDRHLSDSLTNGLWWACENYPWKWKSRITMNHLEILESLFLLGLEPILHGLNQLDSWISIWTLPWFANVAKVQYTPWYGLQFCWSWCRWPLRFSSVRLGGYSCFRIFGYIMVH
jgi:hypothetical protein